MKTIASLDDLSLLNIFNRLPLTHLKTAGRVCTRWCAFRTKSAATRRNLDILLSARHLVPSGAPAIIDHAIPFWGTLVHDDGTEMYPKVARKLQCLDLLELSKLSMDFAQFLAKFFPKVRNLTVVIDQAESCSNIDPLIYLLKSWNLTSLSINANYDRSEFVPDEGESLSKHNRLITVIYSELESLKSLEFYFNGTLSASLSMDLSALKQLETFSFRTRDFAEKQIQSLERFDRTNPNQLKQIYINTAINDIGNLLGLSREFAHKFAHLLTVFPHLNPIRYSPFCSLFANLTTLELVVALPNISHEALFGPLVRMTQLICLSLSLMKGSFLENLVPDEASKQTITLSSIKVFELKNMPHLPTHKIFKDLQFHLLMPNLQVFLLDREPQACLECATAGVDTVRRYAAVCLAKMVEPFGTQCTKLRLLRTIHPNCYWDLSDFLNQMLHISN